MKYLRTLAITWMFTALFAVGSLSAADYKLTVVELYTSQGCSSCPPADALLGRLSKMDNILALSFHVDYWDYIGWKDPFGSPANSNRQRQYSRAFKKSYVYTPQMVVHGMAEMTGSDERKVIAGIDRIKDRTDIPITAKRDSSGGFAIYVGATNQPSEASVWLAFFDPVHTTKVRRGENRGKTVSNFNVVRQFRKIGEWRGKRLKLEISAKEIEQHKGRGCAIFLQNVHKGPILGATSINLAANKLPQR
jgi:hypothetical protein